MTPVRASDLSDESPHSDEFFDAWLYRVKSLGLQSPLDEKARDAAIAYFDIPRSISGCAARLGVKRDTATRRLQRAHEKGWITLFPAPDNAREATLPRVASRNVFWPEGLPVWDGDTSNPLF